MKSFTNFVSQPLGKCLHLSTFYDCLTWIMALSLLMIDNMNKKTLAKHSMFLNLPYLFWSADDDLSQILKSNAQLTFSCGRCPICKGCHIGGFEALATLLMFS